MNVKLLRRIQKHILAEPKRYSQGAWLHRGLTGEGAPPCGTRACIAGWACVLGDKGAVSGWRVRDTAKELLNLSEDESDKLFAYPSSQEPEFWPPKFSAQYHRAKTYRGKVAAAVRRIDHFIKTAGKE